MTSSPERPSDLPHPTPFPPRRPREPEQPRIPSTAALLSDLNWDPDAPPAANDGTARSDALPRDAEERAHVRAVAEQMVAPELRAMRSGGRTVPVLALLAVTAIASAAAAIFVVANVTIKPAPPAPASSSEATAPAPRQPGPVAAAPQFVVVPPSAPLAVDEASPLGVSVWGAGEGVELAISGFAPGSTFSAGRPIGSDSWLITASDIRNAIIAPPRGFVGAMDIAFDLRWPGGGVADRKVARMEWAAAPAPAQAQPASPPMATRAGVPPSGVAALAPAAVAPATGATVRGVSDREIRFGISAPFSGPAKELGRQMKLGIDTAFNQANDAGGVHGRLLRLVAADDGYEPARTAETMRHLYDKEQVFGVIGNVGTPTATVAVPYALERRMLFFGAFTGASLLRRDPPDRYVFNYRASYAEETDAVVRYLVKVRRLRPEEIAVFAQQDAYGDAGFAGVAKAMRALRGGDGGVILRLNYKRNTVDVQEAVNQLRAHKGPIKAVVMVATYRAAAKFIEKARELYPTMIFTNVSFVGSTALADELTLLGARYATGVIVTQVVPAVSSYSTMILEYKSALAKYFPGEAPDYVSLEGYVTANLLIEALRRTGPQLDTEKLVDGLESLRNLDLGLGTQLTFGRTEHQASHKVWGTVLDEAGHYQALELQ